MSGAHTIHVRIDAASPKWSSGYYRFEQHYQFTLPNEQDTQYALARLAELCDELRTPVRDAVPDTPADEGPAFYTVDFSDSDSNYHHYCAACYRLIPDFLMRWNQPDRPPYISGGEPIMCEGCGKAADPPAAT